MERSKPTHGGFPGGPTDTPESVAICLQIMPESEWYAIEQAARSTDPRRADFYRSIAGYEEV